MPAEYPVASAGNGSKFMITTLPPDTHDSAGFKAIPKSSTGDGTDGWIEAGCVITGGIPGENRNYSDVTCWSGTSSKVIGSAVMEAVSYELLLNPKSAGQELIEELKTGQEIVWVAIQLPEKVNETHAFAAYVSNVRPAISTSDEAIMFNFDLVPIFDVNGLGVVKYATV